MLVEDRQEILNKLKVLVADYQRLSPAYKKESAEKKAEEFVLDFFEVLGWKRRSEEVIPQKKIRRVGVSERVDYSFKLAGALKPSLYVEVKRFSNKLEDAAIVKQAIDYGKNGGARWAVLTNFHTIRIFNSNYYDDPQNAELFAPIDLLKSLDDPLVLDQILLLSRQACTEERLDHYAKLHKKWKESADIEELLTKNLVHTRVELSKAMWEQNVPLFEGEKNREQKLDECVQLLLDRLIFCRILEDNGADEDRKLYHEYEKWEKDKRVQFYSDCILPFFNKMKGIYDSTIFETHKIDNLRIKNETFVEVFNSFYFTKDGLRYRFDAIPVDVLGHVYENYLSYKAKKTPSRTGIEEEMYKRKSSGIYYTPSFLVEYLVKNTVGKKLAKCKKPEEALRIKVLDPACGSGTFLIRAYEEFKKWYLEHPEATQTTLNSDEVGLHHFLDRVMENCLYGIDLDPRAVELTRLNLFIRAIGNPKKLPNLHIANANTLVSDHEYEELSFIFSRDFPIVYEEGGFDVVITNPPWEKWKPDSQEFFEPHDPGFKSLPAPKAKARMKELLSKRPYLRKKWLEYTTHYEILSEHFRDQKNFQSQSDEADGRQVSGDLDLYKLFTEKAYQLLKPDGVAGLVVPSGIYTDLGAKGLRRMLFENCKLEGIYGFENRKFIFPDIDQRYKFVLLTFKKDGKTKEFPAAFFLYSKEELADAQKAPTILDIEFIKKSSPTSWNVIEIKNPAAYLIVKKMLAHPHLGDEISDSWNIDLSRGFDMTNDSHLFKPYGDGVPMLEGKNIEQFTHKWKDAPTPRHSITEADIASNLKEDKSYHKDYWLAYRLIASSTNHRTLISAIIPPGYVCGNSLAIIRMQNPKELCFLCGVLNSFVLDYLIRQKVSTNVNMFYFKELPTPRLRSGPVFDAIVRKVAQLSCTTSEFKKLKEAAGIDFAISEENDRAVVRAQIDALVAKLYNITRDDMVQILSVFPLVDEKTKNLVLQEYDKITP